MTLPAGAVSTDSICTKLLCVHGGDCFLGKSCDAFRSGAVNDRGGHSSRSIDIIELTTANIDDEGISHVELVERTPKLGFRSEFVQSTRCKIVASTSVQTVDVGILHGRDWCFIGVVPKA